MCIKLARFSGFQRPNFTAILLSKAEPDMAILFAPFRRTHPPTHVLPFQLTPNLSPKSKWHHKMEVSCQIYPGEASTLPHIHASYAVLITLHAFASYWMLETFAVSIGTLLALRFFETDLKEDSQGRLIHNMSMAGWRIDKLVAKPCLCIHSAPPVWSKFAWSSYSTILICLETQWSVGPVLDARLIVPHFH